MAAIFFSVTVGKTTESRKLTEELKDADAAFVTSSRLHDTILRTASYYRIRPAIGVNIYGVYSKH